MKKAALEGFLVLALTASIFAAGGGERSAQEPGGLKVVATTTIVGDVVGQVLQDNGELTVLMPVGQNPHSYTPAPRDIAAMESADIIFVNGLELEEQLMPVIKNLDGPLVVEVSRGLTPREGGYDHHDEEDDHHDEEDDHHDEEDDRHDEEDDHHDEEDDHHDEEDDHDYAAGDPHFWFSPVKVMHWVHVTEEALSEVDPANASAYEEAAEAYEARLKALDEEVRDLVDTIPPEDRKIVMDHSSVGYFADDYGFTILANLLPGSSDQAEPSARQIAEVVELVNDNDVRAIFVGDTAPQSVVKMAEAVAAETDRPLPVVSILTGSLTASGRGSDYLDFVRYTTEQIVEALAR